MKTHLIFALLAAAMLALVISQSRKDTLSFENVILQAQNLAAEPWQPVQAVDSQRLQKLNYDQYRDIRWKEDQTLWRRLGLPFQIKFFITGHLHNTPITLFQVNRDSARQLKFAADYFDYGPLASDLNVLDKASGGFSGFRVHYPLNRPDLLDEVLVFLGKSYFRSLAREQVYGLSARGLAIDVHTPATKEEFPKFTAFWLVQPGANDKRLTLYALLDGPSVTGAYEFNVTPGDATRIDVRSVLFFRKKVVQLGIAPMSSMFWYGENTSNTFGGFRPEVHDSDGLLIRGSNEEWLWRPLSWSKNTQVNTFAADHLKGFGLLQRDRNFNNYQDLEVHYQKRPSLWIEPQGDWGRGEVKLVQFATDNEYWDNVVAFWEPDKAPEKGDRLELAYTLHWTGDEPSPRTLGKSVATRIDYQEAPYFRIFVVDFAGDQLAGLPPETPLQIDLSADNDAVLDKIHHQKNINDNTWRVTFTASVKTLHQAVELRASLKQNDIALTETWTSTWIPQ